MNPNENYSIVDGRIRTRSLEIHIVDHCNLRCRACCSLSQISEKKLSDPQAVTADLALAKKFLAPSRLKLVGGEPLLHPRIIECLQVAKDSAIAPSLSVTTNGFLLPKMADEFWHLVDHLTVSLYPDPTLPEASIALIRVKAELHQVELNWKEQNSFVSMDPDQPETNPEVTRAIYDECWLRRRCHLIAYGRFYTCTRPSHFHAVSALDDSPFLNDGISLDCGESIYDYLISKNPLASCTLCLGGNAKAEPHRQLTHQEAKAEQQLRRSLYQAQASATYL